jgi:hypothetical protein
MSTDDEWNEWLNKTTPVVREFVATVVGLVGREKARSLFSEALKEPPRGKRANVDRINRELAAYQQQIENGADPKNAALRAA